MKVVLQATLAFFKRLLRRRPTFTGVREKQYENLQKSRTHTGKAAGLSQARERWRVYDVAREVQAAC